MKHKKHISDIIKKIPDQNKSGGDIGKKADIDLGEISWKAPEFIYEAKTVSWYWLSLIISIVLIAVSLWQKNFLFVVFVIIAELVLIYFSNQFPKIWDFKITDRGIFVGRNKIYKYEDIIGFDIHHATDEYKELVLHMKSKIAPYIKIFIDPEEEEKIEKKLLEFVQREEIQPSLVDTVERIMRF